MDVSNKIMQDGKQVKLSASEIIIGDEQKSESVEKFANKTTQIIRVDTLSSPMQITATDFANPDIVPLTAGYTTGNIFLVELGTATDGRNNHGIIVYGTINNSAGHSVVCSQGTDVVLVSRCRNSGNPNTIGFYNARLLSGSAQNLYVFSVYLIKPQHP